MEVLTAAISTLNCNVSFDISTVGSMLPLTFSPADIQVLAATR